MNLYTKDSNPNPTQSLAVSLLSTLPESLTKEASLQVSQELGITSAPVRLTVYNNGSLGVYFSDFSLHKSSLARIAARARLLQAIRKLGFEVETIGRKFCYLHFKPLA